MLQKDRAVKPSADLDDFDDDLKSEIKGKGWALYEEETPDKKKYPRGPSKGKPMKNVVIEFPNGPAVMKVTLPREAFVDMVKQYFKIKGY
jgi:hypothetical protein